MESEEIPGTPLAPAENSRRQIFRQTFQLSVSNVVIQISRFFKNLLLAGMLGPPLFGLWNGLQVFITYGMNAHLGVLQAMGREIPMRRGEGSPESIQHLANAGLTASFLFSIAGGALTAAIALLTIATGADSRVPALLLLPVLVAQMLFLFGQSLLRAEDEFGTLSRALSVTAILELGATILLVWLLGFNGVLIGLGLSQAVGAFLCFRVKRSYSLRFVINGPAIRGLVRMGFPIMLTILGYFVLTTIDRLLVISYAGSEALGYYALGSLAITGIGYIPIAVNQVMYPRFALRFGETRDPAALSGYLRIPALTLAHGMGLVLGLAGLSLPLIAIILPEYVPGIPAAQILLAGFFFVAITGSSANLLLTINRQLPYLAILAGAIALVVVLDIAALRSGMGIEGVAAATAGTNALYAVVLIQFTIRKHLSRGSKPFGPLMVKLFLPWFAGLFLAVALSLFVTGGTIATVIIRILAFTVVYVPLSFLVLRQEKIW